MSRRLPKILILTLAVVLVFFMLVFMAFHSVEQNAINLCKNRFLSDAESSLERIEEDFRHNREVLASMADLFSKYIDLSDTEGLVRRVSYFSSFFKADGLNVILPDGKMIAVDRVFDTPEEFDFVELSSRGSHTSAVSESIFRDGNRVIRQYEPVVVGGRTAAIIYCVTFCSSISKYFNTEFLGASGYYALVERSSGKFLYKSSPYDLENLNEYPVSGGENGKAQERAVRGILGGGSGQEEFIDYVRREPIILYYQPVNVNDWSLVLTVNRRHAFREVFSNQILLRALTSIGFFAFSLFVMIIYADDLKKEKRLEEQQKLEESHRKAMEQNFAKSAFIDSMGHEIRTPLNSIIGYSRIAKKHIADPEKLSSSLHKIEIAGDMLSDTVRNILDMTSIECGNFYLDESPVNLGRMAKEIGVLVEPLAEEKKVLFTLEVVNLLNENVFADGTHLKQIVVNLLNGALKYTKTGGRVSLRMEQVTSNSDDYAYYKFSVKDTGAGMDRELVEKLMGSSLADGEVTLEDYKKIGINLLTAKRIVDAMSGTMAVVSKIGEGSTVSFQLRIKILPEPQIYNIFMQDCEEYDFRGKRVLVVEDNVLNRELVRDILLEQDIQIEEAEDGDEAVRMVTEAEENYYSAVLMDLHMPYLDGFSAAKEIRTLKNMEKALVPIVAMTSDGNREEKKLVVKAGMNGVIVKPVKPREVLAALKGVMTD